MATCQGSPASLTHVASAAWSKKRIELTHAKYLELGLESPYSQEWLDRPWQDNLINASIPIDGYSEVRFDALLAHATQIDPESPFWFGLPREVAASIHPYDDYIRASSRVPVSGLEDDLFAGLHADAPIS